MGHLPASDGWSSWAVGMATSRGDSPSHSTRRRRGRAGRRPLVCQELEARPAVPSGRSPSSPDPLTEKQVVLEQVGSGSLQLLLPEVTYSTI